MDNLHTTLNLVKYILETESSTRNSDSLLYLKVIENEAQQMGIPVANMSVFEFLNTHRQLGFTGFETVRRTRQKVQASHPELAASQKVAAYRAANETEFRAFAKEEM